MKRKILVKIASIMLALNLFSSSIVLAKEQEKKVEIQEKKPSKKEQKKTNIKIIKEELKNKKEFNKKTQLEFKKMFKNFKKQDFEEQNYDLEVFKTNEVPVLLYTHKKTGAQVYFNLILDKEEKSQFKEKSYNKLIFKTTSKDDSGLVHFCEHCIASPMLNKISNKQFLKASQQIPINASTQLVNLDIRFLDDVFLNNSFKEEFFKYFFENLNNPKTLVDEKFFEVEKKRIINEMKDKLNYNGLSYPEYLNESVRRDLLRQYNPLGNFKKIKDVTLKDFRKFFKNYIHPSNCLLIKNITKLTPKEVKSCLKLWHENYFKNYDRKIVKDNVYVPKNNKQFIFNNWFKDADIFKKSGEKTSYEYVAKIYYSLKDLKISPKQIRDLKISCKAFEKELKDFVKSLGYEDYSLGLNYDNGRIENFYSVFGIEVNFGETVVFYGNKKELFEEKTLKQNSKKVLEFVKNKLKNLSEDDFLYSKFEGNSTFLRKEIHNLGNDVYSSFILFKKAISDKFFIIENGNEIKDLYDCDEKQPKENFDVYDILINNQPKFIDVFEKGEKTYNQTFEDEIKKYKTLKRVIPISLQQNQSDFKNNAALYFITNHLNKVANFKEGLIYSPIEPFYFLDGLVGVYELNKDSVLKFEDYIKNNFKNLIENVKITEKDLRYYKDLYSKNFEILKEIFKKSIKNLKLNLQSIKGLDHIEKNDINNSQLRFDIDAFGILHGLFYCGMLFKDFKEFEQYFEKNNEYLNNFEKYKNYEIKNKLLEKLNLKLNMLKKAFKKAEKVQKDMEKVTALDVLKIVKTAALEKDKQKLDKFNKQLNSKKIIGLLQMIE